MDQDKIKLNDYQANPLYNKVHDSIEKEKFFQPLNTGLWEFLISDKKLVLLQNEFDNHPNSLCHFYYFKNYIKPKLDHKYKPLDNLQHLEDQATRFSEYYAGLSWYKFNDLCNDEPFDVRPGRFKENKRTFFNIFGW